MIDSCVGYDPGPTTGICLLEYENGRLIGRTVLQCEGSTAPYVLRGLLATYSPRFDGRRVGSGEAWVEGPAAGRKYAGVTRQLVYELKEELDLAGYTTNVRPAGDVKPWATDRLVKAALNLKALTDDLRHGWDGARHCLYGAHDAGVIAHPLLKRNPFTGETA